MKSTLFVFVLVLVPLLSFGQVQIGQDIDGEAMDDMSGTSLSISSDGTIIAIGAPRNDGNGGAAGHVRVYEDQGGSWVQIGQDIDGETAVDWFGNSVDLSSDGTIIAIGAPKNEGGGSVNAGHVKVYQNQGGNWVQIGQEIAGESVFDESGSALSLSSDGTIVAITASKNSNGNGSGSGHVRVFENQGGSWNQIGQDIDGEAMDDASGNALSLSSDGTVLAIGSKNNDGNGDFSGHVRVYEIQGGSWVQIGQDFDGEAIYDLSGTSVSLSSDGTIVAIGASVNDGNGSAAGHVRVYENQGGSWVQIGQDIDGEETGALSGTSVSLSSDGTIVAIGASESSFFSSTDIGYVSIYKNQGGTWVQVGSDINGEAIEDEFGTTVSLSSDGATVAIGTPFNDGNGDESGHVRVYDLSGALSAEEITQVQFSIYPNPASTTFTLELDENSSLEKATIYNSLGQVIKQVTTVTINTSDLSKGLYFVEIETNQGTGSRELIIE